MTIELPRDLAYSSFKFNTSLCPEILPIANAYVTTAEATRFLSNWVRRVRNVIVEGRAHSSLYHIYPQDIDCERTLRVSSEKVGAEVSAHSRGEQ